MSYSKNKEYLCKECGAIDPKKFYPNKSRVVCRDCILKKSKSLNEAFKNVDLDIITPSAIARRLETLNDEQDDTYGYPDGLNWRQRVDKYILDKKDENLNSKMIDSRLSILMDECASLKKENLVLKEKVDVLKEKVDKILTLKDVIKDQSREIDLLKEEMSFHENRDSEIVKYLHKFNDRLNVIETAFDQ